MSEDKRALIEAFGKLSVSTVSMGLIGLTLYFVHVGTIDFNRQLGTTIRESVTEERRSADAMHRVADSLEKMAKDYGYRLEKLEAKIK